MYSIMRKFLEKLKKKKRVTIVEPPVMSENTAETEHAKCQTTFRSLLQADGNKNCADCNAQNPTWASWNIGIFLCINCASIHRSLGTAVSKVKSVSLDKWTLDQMRYLEMMGNAKSRTLYEHLLPEGYVRPMAREALQSFIEKKYVDKFYFSKNGNEVLSQLPSPLPGVNANKRRRPKKYTESIIKLDVEKFERLNALPVLMPSHASSPTPKKDDDVINELLLHFDPFFCKSNKASTGGKERASDIPKKNPTEVRLDQGQRMSNESILSLYNVNTPNKIQNNPFRTNLEQSPVFIRSQSLLSMKATTESNRHNTP